MDEALPGALSGKHQAGGLPKALPAQVLPVAFKVWSAVGLEATVAPFFIIRDPGYSVSRISAKISFKIMHSLIFR